MGASRPRHDDSAPSDISALSQKYQHLGWCPHQFHRLRQSCTPGTLRYLSNLDRRGYRSNHHHECETHPCCVANNVNKGKYNKAHTETCSGLCSDVSVDYDEVVNIISAGGIPIIGLHVNTASASGEPVPFFSVTARSTATRYTVISHVWFDGLGNPSANALPACQVQRLYTRLVSLPRDHESNTITVGSLQIDWSRQSFLRYPERQPLLFWMDTLCIPVGSEHEHLRKKAIGQMASIYAAAVQELVLDAELMQHEAANGAALETLSRVVCSAWMTRSWTLQEGVLARECVFQFKDCAIDLTHEWCLRGARPVKTTGSSAVRFPLPTDKYHRDVYEELYNILWDMLHQDWKSRYRRDPPIAHAHQGSGGSSSDLRRFGGSYAAGKIHTLPAAHGLSERGQDGLDETDHFTMQLTEKHRTKQLVDTWNELAHRSTTMPEDLHVIIANLLDFNADRIMDIELREERMRAMILSFDTLPVSLFWNAGPKWSDGSHTDTGSNNRWIPSEPSKSELTMAPVMTVTAEWLEMILGPKSGAQVFSLHENGVGIFEQSSFLCSGLSEQVYDVTLLDAQSDAKQAARYSVLPNASHYLIVESSKPPSSPTLTKGALFRRLLSESTDKDGVLRLSYCCPVSLRALGRDLSLDERHAIAESMDTGITVAVKYGQSHFLIMVVLFIRNHHFHSTTFFSGTLLNNMNITAETCQEQAN